MCHTFTMCCVCKDGWMNFLLNLSNKKAKVSLNRMTNKKKERRRRDDLRHSHTREAGERKSRKYFDNPDRTHTQTHTWSEEGKREKKNSFNCGSTHCEDRLQKEINLRPKIGWARRRKGCLNVQSNLIKLLISKHVFKKKKKKKRRHVF